MTDLINKVEPEISLDDEVRCVERELKFRTMVYPRLVSKGRMTTGTMNREIALMESILARLKSLKV